jgi:hypothetical protein
MADKEKKTGRARAPTITVDTSAVNADDKQGERIPFCLLLSTTPVNSWLPDHSMGMLGISRNP